MRRAGIAPRPISLYEAPDLSSGADTMADESRAGPSFARLVARADRRNPG